MARGTGKAQETEETVDKPVWDRATHGQPPSDTYDQYEQIDSGSAVASDDPATARAYKVD